MTRRDFQLIAGALHDVRPIPGPAIAARLMQHAATAGRLADVLRTTNPRFDRDRFMRASGVED